MIELVCLFEMIIFLFVETLVFGFFFLSHKVGSPDSNRNNAELRISLFHAIQRPVALQENTLRYLMSIRASLRLNIGILLHQSADSHFLFLSSRHELKWSSNRETNIDCAIMEGSINERKLSLDFASCAFKMESDLIKVGLRLFRKEVICI